MFLIEKKKLEEFFSVYCDFLFGYIEQKSLNTVQKYSPLKERGPNNGIRYKNSYKDNLKMSILGCLETKMY